MEQSSEGGLDSNSPNLTLPVPTELRSGDSAEQRWWRKNYREVCIGIFAFVPLAFLVKVIFFSTTSLGTPNSADATFIRMNELLYQSVQWTIGTVLTLGVALIGFNWITSERSHDRDRTSLKEYRDFLAEQQRLSELRSTRRIEIQDEVIASLRTQILENKSEETSRLNTVEYSIKAMELRLDSSTIPIADSIIDQANDALASIIRKSAPIELALVKYGRFWIQLQMLGNKEAPIRFVEKTSTNLDRLSNSDWTFISSSRDEILETISDFQETRSAMTSMVALPPLSYAGLARISDRLRAQLAKIDSGLSQE